MSRNKVLVKRLMAEPGYSSISIDKDILLQNDILDCVDNLDGLLEAPGVAGPWILKTRNILIDFHNLMSFGDLVLAATKMEKNRETMAKEASKASSDQGELL